MSPRTRIVSALALAAAAAYMLRPVRRPETPGTWRPAEPHRTHR